MAALYGAELRFGKRAAGVVRAARGSPMSETRRDYQVGRGKPPVHRRFKKGQSGNPRRPRPRSLPALLAMIRDQQLRRGPEPCSNRAPRQNARLFKVGRAETATG